MKMRKDQENLLRLIKEIDQICKENNIVYYAAGGTVIGALRHKGFIPWDDDIDIYMTRDNWKKFLNCFDKSAPERRILECWENNKGYHNLLARYMDLDTTSIFKYQIYGDANMGQLIDIFVLDPVINSKDAIKEYEKNVFLASDLISECIMYSNRLQEAGEYEKYITRMETEGKERVVQEVYEKLEKHKEEESDCYMLRWGGMPHIFPKEMFTEPKYYPFEDMMMPLPSKVSDYLIQLYGLDWVNVPGRAGQITHNSISNNEYPFQTFKELILPRVDSNAEEKFVSKKKRIFNDLQFIHSFNNEMLDVEGAYVKRNILNNIKEKEIDILNIVEERNFEQIQNIFKSYIDIQCDAEFIGNGTFAGYYKKLNPTFIDLGDENLYAVLYFMMETGKIAKADRLLNIRKTVVERPLAECLVTLQNLLEDIKKAANLYEFRHYQEAKSIIDKWVPKIKSNQLYKFELFLMKQLAEDCSKSQEYEEILQTALTTYPEDIDFTKFKADYLWNVGDKQEALSLYTKVLQRCNNGVLCLHVKEQLEAHLSHVRDYLDTLYQDDVVEWRKGMSTWLKCFEGSKELLKDYVIRLYESGYDMSLLLFEKNISRTCKKEDTCLVMTDILSEVCGWKKENIYIEILAKTKRISEITEDMLVQDGTDLSEYQRALCYMNIGERNKEYALYIKLRYSNDEYVKTQIRLKLRKDLKRYIKQAKQNKIGFLRCDYNIRYSNMPFEEYIQLLRDFDVICQDEEFLYTNSIETFMVENIERFYGKKVEE